MIFRKVEPSSMLTIHDKHDQFPFKQHSRIITDNFVMYRDNKYVKTMLNNRHDKKLGKHTWAGYAYVIFDRHTHTQVGLIWLLNQVTANTTYIRVSRYMALASGYFIAVLDELNDMFNGSGYSFRLKTGIEYAQHILNMNYVGSYSKASSGKRGHNDRSKKSSAVDGITYDLSEKLDTFNKWHNNGDSNIEA